MFQTKLRIQCFLADRTANTKPHWQVHNKFYHLQWNNSQCCMWSHLGMGILINMANNPSFGWLMTNKAISVTRKFRNLRVGSPPNSPTSKKSIDPERPGRITRKAENPHNIQISFTFGFLLLWVKNQDESNFCKCYQAIMVRDNVGLWKLKWVICIYNFRSWQYW